MCDWIFREVSCSFFARAPSERTLLVSINGVIGQFCDSGQISLALPDREEKKVEKSSQSHMWPILQKKVKKSRKQKKRRGDARKNCTRHTSEG